MAKADRKRLIVFTLLGLVVGWGTVGPFLGFYLAGALGGAIGGAIIGYVVNTDRDRIEEGDVIEGVDEPDGEPTKTDE